MSFGGVTLALGSAGEDVRTIQLQLNRISDNFPALPKVRADGVYGTETEEAVRTFQRIFHLPQTGEVDFATWYSISNIYVAVAKAGVDGIKSAPAGCFLPGRTNLGNVTIELRPGIVVHLPPKGGSGLHSHGKITAAMKAAFPYTIPIFAGFWFLGITYGVYMQVSGFSFWYPMLMSLTIFGGSLEFVAVSMLLSAFAPVQTLVVALMLQARHLFYGIAMLDKFKGTGWKKVYLIFGMCDESFSINCSAEIPAGIDKGWFMFFVTLFNQIYWVTGATLGGLLGALIPFNTEGLDFAMTTMFVVIFLDSGGRRTGMLHP